MKNKFNKTASVSQIMILIIGIMAFAFIMGGVGVVSEGIKDGKKRNN